jgi:hypothetical protein
MAADAGQRPLDDSATRQRDRTWSSEGRADQSQRKPLASPFSNVKTSRSRTSTTAELAGVQPPGAAETSHDQTDTQGSPKPQHEQQQDHTEHRATTGTGGHGGAKGIGTDPGTSDPSPLAGRTRTALLGLLLVLLGIALLSSLVSLWPAVQDATTPAAGAHAPPNTVSVDLLWLVNFNLAGSAVLLLLVLNASAIGSYIHATTSFADFVGNRRFVTSWTWWYLLRFFIGMALAVLLYFALRGGFFTGTATNATINPYGIAALSGLAGLFHKQATDKLREVFGTLFAPAAGKADAERADDLSNPTPKINDVDPKTVTRGRTVPLVLTGSGFQQSSRIVLAVDGKPVGPPRRATFDRDANTLRFTIKDSEVATGDQLSVRVTNPAPGGGTSNEVLIPLLPIDQ